MSSSANPPPDLRAAVDAIRVCRRPLPVRVTFAGEGGVCQTREGGVRYREGDAIVTGVDGEQWPVDRQRFASTYDAVSPTRDGHDGLYVPRKLDMLALQLQSPMTVFVGSESDPLRGKPGDWLLQHGDGSYGIVSSDLFTRIFESGA